MNNALLVDNRYVMKKFSAVIDTVLTIAAFFLLGGVIAGYFMSGRATIITFAVVFSLSVTFFTGKFSEKRRAPRVRKDKLRELSDKFVFSPQSYAYGFALDAIRRKREVTESDGLIIAGKTAFAVCLTCDKVSQSELIKLYCAAAGKKPTRLVVLSVYGGEQDAEDTARALSEPKTEIWDFEKVYSFFSYLGCPPTETVKFSSPKRKFSAVLRTALRRENARKYLFASVVTLFFARFMPYAVLYVVIAAVSATLAVLCRLDIVSRISEKKV